MKKKYQTIYSASYGTVKAVFKEKLTFEEAEQLGKEQCQINNWEYIGTEEVL